MHRVHWKFVSNCGSRISRILLRGCLISKNFRGFNSTWKTILSFCFDTKLASKNFMKSLSKFTTRNQKTVVIQISAKSNQVEILSCRANFGSFGFIKNFTIEFKFYRWFLKVKWKFYQTGVHLLTNRRCIQTNKRSMIIMYPLIVAIFFQFLSDLANFWKITMSLHFHAFSTHFFRFQAKNWWEATYIHLIGIW